MAALPAPDARPGASDRARGTGAPRELVFPPSLFIRCGHIGGVVAEHFADHDACVEAQREYKVRILISRLLFDKPDVAV